MPSNRSRVEASEVAARASRCEQTVLNHRAEHNPVPNDGLALLPFDVMRHEMF
jgi:hypothetical protein